MTTRTDLVMPKLGLTMTEGKVASWNVQPGASFTAGDIIVVVETDKIAFDVEAPGAGALAEILVPEGETVAVGTPIAQWLPADGTAAAQTPTETEAVPSEAPVAAPATVAAPAAAPSSAARPATGSRIVATPYARRLARNADLDLATITAANGRRITAADVEAGIARRSETPGAAAPAPATHAGPSAAPAFVFYGTDVAADRLLELIGEIAAAHPDLQPSLSHFTAFAAARALGANGGMIALQHNDRPPRLLAMDATRRLSTIIAADRAETANPDGHITLLVSDADGAMLVGRAPVDCDAVLGVGALTRAFHPDADGQPVLRAQFNLMLTVGTAAALPDAPGLLTRIRTLLENPLLLLAS